MTRDERSTMGEGGPPLPRRVEEHLRRVNRLEPPIDLMDEVVGRIEELQRPHRLGWLFAGARVAGAVAVLALAAYGLVSLLPLGGGPPIGGPDDATPTVPSSIVQLEPPNVDSLPVAGEVEQTWALEQGGYPAAFGHGSLWLATDPAGTLLRVDPATGALQARIEISGPVDRPYNMAPAVDDRWVWVSSGEDGAIVRVDPETNEVAGRFEVDAAGYQLISTGTDVYMTDFDRDLLVHLDAETGDMEDRLPLAGGPAGLAVTDEGLWVSLWRQERLLLMDPQTLQTFDEYEISLSSITLTPNGDDIWISGNNSRPLERFSIPERRVVARTSEMSLVLHDGDPWGLTFAGELVQLNPETLAWAAGRQVDMRGCDCNNLVAGPDRLYIGTSPDEILVIAP